MRERAVEAGEDVRGGRDGARGEAWIGLDDKRAQAGVAGVGGEAVRTAYVAEMARVKRGSAGMVLCGSHAKKT